MKKIFTVICLFLALIFLFNIGFTQACNMCGKSEKIHNGVLFASIDANRVILPICRVEDVSFSENYGVTTIKPREGDLRHIEGFPNTWETIKPEEMKQVNPKLGKRPTPSVPYNKPKMPNCLYSEILMVDNGMFGTKPGGKPNSDLNIMLLAENRRDNLVYKMPINNEPVLLAGLRHDLIF